MFGRLELTNMAKKKTKKKAKKRVLKYRVHFDGKWYEVHDPFGNKVFETKDKHEAKMHRKDLEDAYQLGAGI